MGTAQAGDLYYVIVWVIVRPGRPDPLGRRGRKVHYWLDRGGSTIYLGTDDENGRTSLGGVDLYPDPLMAAAQIQNLRRHPFEFYRKLGFAIVGVLPDANGFGKPDIFMAKRVRTTPDGA